MTLARFARDQGVHRPVVRGRDHHHRVTHVTTLEAPLHQREPPRVGQCAHSLAHLGRHDAHHCP
jgi:hypothetical protein